MYNKILAQGHVPDLDKIAVNAFNLPTTQEIHKALRKEFPRIAIVNIGYRVDYLKRRFYLDIVVRKIKNQEQLQKHFEDIMGVLADYTDLSWEDQVKYNPTTASVEYRSFVHDYRPRPVMLADYYTYWRRIHGSLPPMVISPIKLALELFEEKKPS